MHKANFFNKLPDFARQLEGIANEAMEAMKASYAQTSEALKAVEDEQKREELEFLLQSGMAHAKAGDVAQVQNIMSKLKALTNADNNKPA